MRFGMSDVKSWWENYVRLPARRLAHLVGRKLIIQRSRIRILRLSASQCPIAISQLFPSLKCVILFALRIPTFWLGDHNRQAQFFCGDDAVFWNYGLHSVVLYSHRRTTPIPYDKLQVKHSWVVDLVWTIFWGESVPSVFRERIKLDIRRFHR